MKIEKTTLEGVFIIEPDIFADSRGWFYESYSKQKLSALGLNVDFVQDNHSYSATRFTLRGLHFQSSPKSQGKLIRCTKGRIFDVAIDIRKGSMKFGKWFGIELTPENKKQLFIPRGFAHGFLTLENNTEVMYKADEYYAPEYDHTIIWNDPDIKIDWETSTPILSDKDSKGKTLKEIEEIL